VPEFVTEQQNAKKEQNKQHYKIKLLFIAAVV